jgi:release factor glutamine methyltransferase
MALQILEVGSGSGCIAISLAKVLSNCIIDAIDISQGALKVAKKNSRLHKVKINFMPSDLFSNQKLNDSNYDLIISNPPYIPTEEIKKLQPEIRFEPDVALDGGSDGLDFFRRIIAESPRYLKDRGLLMIEIGFNQKYAVRDIISKSSALEIIETVKDYRGFERVIVAKKR